MTTSGTVLVVQHGARDLLGHAGRALRAEGLTADVRNVARGDALPTSLAGHDGVLVCGGAQDAFRDAGFPTRQQELALVRAALRDGVPLLGICLGAQLLAQAAGAEGYRGERRETGWCTVRPTPAAALDPLWSGLPGELRVMQNHGNHFPLPPGAVLLVRGEADYRFQAFRVGARAWGMQFHLEADETMDYPAGMAEGEAFLDARPWAELVFRRFARVAAAGRGLLAA
ncbi:GMP synthase-like glutamine amidotransferase [Motilibacter rhizosphaerae]|uniref:GMP synthase-like glutamine amidotransferase n=1 Tax=Motilibacter rhizosphaerae TaxID=598652 RepID=A0A4Q7NB63_9ACTN|nr:type 1 glutamine amidotransferase [Motilibacter rhizosphaerae]RZS79409.1 GMP synthase-like glutamine amidotransferase [Motilibacter rhizosphaerae]